MIGKLQRIRAQPLLPEEMPFNWALFEPVMILSLYLLMLLLPLIDPWRPNYARFSSVYRLFRWLMVLFMSGVCILSKAEGIGFNLETGVVINAGVALLFIIIGNVMGQIPRNLFVGIKLPWTLANEEVWRRTHRLAAKIWGIGGFVCLVLAPVQAPWSTRVFVACLAVMALVPLVHSYITYRKVVRGNKASDLARKEEWP